MKRRTIDIKVVNGIVLIKDSLNNYRYIPLASNVASVVEAALLLDHKHILHSDIQQDMAYDKYCHRTMINIEEAYNESN
jgi:hypothetical protein